MGKTLENIFKGASGNLAKLADPVGAVISYLDKSATGIGPCDKNALPTISNYIQKEVYTDHAQQIEPKDYAQRYIGSVIGAAAGIGLYIAAPITLLAPIATGIYSTIVSGIRYAKDFIKGEENQKATFSDGFKLGYEQMTSYLGTLHDIEGSVTGRGLRDSQSNSPIHEAAKKTKRNLASVTGNIIGKGVGAIVSFITLGLTPLYKTIRDAPKALGSLAAA